MQHAHIAAQFSESQLNITRKISFEINSWWFHFMDISCNRKWYYISWNKKLSWCWQTRATRLEVSQGH